MKIYVSLPITGKKEGAAIAASIEKTVIAAAGDEAVTPFDIHAGENPGYFDHLCANLRVLADCDAIRLMPGWQESLGCRIEYDFARRTFKRIEYPGGTVLDLRECVLPPRYGNILPGRLKR